MDASVATGSCRKLQAKEDEASVQELNSSDSEFVCKESGEMTQDEIRSTVDRLESGMNSLTDEWTEFLRIETRKRAEAEIKAVEEAENWQRKQTLIHKHGGKILSVLFAGISSSLAWYGAEIRSDIQAQQRSEKVEASIEENKSNFKDFKDREFSKVKEDIEELQLDSVNQTIMIYEGFDRMEKTLLKAHPGKFPNEDSLPPKSPDVKKAADEAIKRKTYYEKFGKLEGSSVR